MKRTLLFWDTLLLAALGFVIWFGDAELRATRQRHAAVLTSVPAEQTPPPVPISGPEAARKNGDAEIATANLFSPDRNPDVLLPVDPPKPVPPLPTVYGVSSFSSGARAIMAANPGDSGRTVREGDVVGAFSIVRLNSSEVVFNWDGQEIVRPIADLMNRSGTDRTVYLRPVIEKEPAVANILTLAAGPGPANPGQTRRPCVPGDDSPIGTVVDGFRKVVVPGSSGPRDCYWSLDR